MGEEAKACEVDSERSPCQERPLRFDECAESDQGGGQHPDDDRQQRVLSPTAAPIPRRTFTPAAAAAKLRRGAIWAFAGEACSRQSFISGAGVVGDCLRLAVAVL